MVSNFFSKNGSGSVASVPHERTSGDRFVAIEAVGIGSNCEYCGRAGNPRMGRKYGASYLKLTFSRFSATKAPSDPKSLYEKHGNLGCPSYYISDE